MSSSDNEDVELILDGTPLKFKKSDLISNSDYFRAMFEGDFIERNKDTIPIEGVTLDSMYKIQKLIWDRDHVLEHEEIFSILQAASMLQFNDIKDMCIGKLTELLTPSSCLKTWITTEPLSIKPLYIKAKLLALSEFLEIKDSNSLNELTFEEIYNYLGSVCLKTDNELTVFQTLMNWWYENSDPNSPNMLLQLLSCISFKDISVSHLQEAMLYQDIKDNDTIINVFQCIESIKNKETAEYADNFQKLAKWLLKSKTRGTANAPCILVHITREGSKTMLKYCDKYKRKRPYSVLENNFAILTYDKAAKQFKSFFEIETQKLEELEGYKLIGYKDFVFLFGGEQIMGKGKWNHNFWVYDTIREKWERKSTLSVPRRHFESCIVGSKLYIVGGTGAYRVIQENLLWYDFKADVWSKPLSIPCSRIKCCCYLNKCFLFRTDMKAAYFFDDNVWTEVEVDIKDKLLNKQPEFVIFSYKERLFLKGQYLVELALSNCKLTVVSVEKITDIDYHSIEIAVCDQIVYTLYRCAVDESDGIALEIYNIETKECDYLLKEAEYPVHISAVGKQYKIYPTVRIFAFEHLFVVENNNLVNNIHDFPK